MVEDELEPDFVLEPEVVVEDGVVRVGVELEVVVVTEGRDGGLVCVHDSCEEMTPGAREAGGVPTGTL